VISPPRPDVHTRQKQTQTQPQTIKNEHIMARSKKGRSQLAGHKKKAGTMMIVGQNNSNNDGVLGPVERGVKQQVRKKGNTASKKLNSAVTKKQAKRQEKVALLQLTQAFAAKVAVADNNAESRRNTSSSSLIMGGRAASDAEFAREQASLRDRMHAKKASMVVLSSSAKTRRGKGGRGTKMKVMFDESSATTTDHRQISNRTSTTTTNALQFAPPSFSLTKSTRQLLEETVLGLGGFGVSEKTTLSSTTTPAGNSTAYSGSSFPANNMMMMANNSAWSVIPRPPPNTPIVHKNPFARLSQNDDDDDDRPAGAAAVVPRLTFQPARFEPAVGTMMMDSYVDPDL
jgi:hypothetical protein